MGAAPSSEARRSGPPSPETIGRWVDSLHHFCYRRAAGGHANDGDTFECAIPFEGEAGLLALCRKLGLALATLTPDSPQAEPERAGSDEEAEDPRWPIDDYPQYEEPGSTTLFGVPVYIEVSDGCMHFSVAGAGDDAYELSGADFENAQRLDAEFERLDLNSTERR